LWTAHAFAKISAKSAHVGFRPAPVGFICGQLIQLLKKGKSAQVGFKPARVGFICGQLMQLLKKGQNKLSYVLNLPQQVLFEDSSCNC
jgi:hypothetical protein